MISFGLFPIIKIAVSVLFVILLGVIAERVGPRAAGIISGYPLGAAISLCFIGLEIGPAFAETSAVFTAGGLTATVAFVGGYLLGLRWTEGRGRFAALTVSILSGLAAYGLTALGLASIPIDRVSAPSIAITAMILAGRLFRSIPDAAIPPGVRLRFRVTLLRAGFAAMVILAITTAAHVVGPRWAGLFSAFPMTMLPLLVIIHFTYQPAHVRTIIKNVPRGLVSLLIYVMVVSVSYTRLGIALGTIAGYLAATIYLAAIEYAGNRSSARKAECREQDSSRGSRNVTSRPKG